MHVSAGKEIAVWYSGPLMLTVTGKKMWDDATWDEYIRQGVALHRQHGPFKVIYTIVLGTAVPTASQRRRIAEQGAEVFKTMQWCAFLTNSAMGRVAVNAINLLTRGFSQWETKTYAVHEFAKSQLWLQSKLDFDPIEAHHRIALMLKAVHYDAHMLDSDWRSRLRGTEA